MSFNITRLLAWRYLRGTKEQRSLTAMIWVCALGIFIGTCALGLTISVMNGFEIETHKKLQGISPDISIQAPQETSLESISLQKYLTTTYKTSIAGISDYGIHHVLLQKNDVNEKTVIGIVKTINPQQELQVTPLQDYVSEPLTTLHNNRLIFIGKEIAKEMDLVIGDTVTLLYNQTPEIPLRDAELAHCSVIIGGYLTTGIAEYDTHLLIGSHELMTHLLEKSHINQMGIKLNPKLTSEEKTLILEQLKKLPDLIVTTWGDEYPAIISALTLEKYAMSFVLALITLVASMNSISLLFMFITYKQKEIALLQILGLTRKNIMTIFILFNVLISSLAALCGLTTAYFLGTAIDRYKLIQLPDAYYVSYLPVHTTISSYVIIFIGTLLLSIITALIPLISLHKTSISTTLRFE